MQDLLLVQDLLPADRGHKRRGGHRLDRGDVDLGVEGAVYFDLIVIKEVWRNVVKINLSNIATSHINKILYNTDFTIRNLFGTSCIPTLPNFWNHC